MSRQKGTIDQIQGLQTALNDKQDDLVSGTNIKTINGTSLLGSGNIVISGGGSSLLVATTTLNFGLNSSKGKLFTISDGSVLSTSKIISILYNPKLTLDTGTIKESIDDDEFDDLSFSVRNISDGSFQIYVKTNGLVNNYKTIQYTVQ